MVARDPSAGVAFVVMLAGPGTRGDEILFAQSRLIGKASGIPDTVLALSAAASRRMYDALRAASDTVGLRDRLRTMFRDYVATLSEPQRRALQITDAAIEMQVQQIMMPWFRFFLTYDPRAALRELTVPVLAINGTLDLQVPHAENLAAIGEALRAGGNRDHTVEALPGLNHLFQTATTGAPAEYAAIDETFAPAALQLIGDWIVKRFPPAR
jgi:pimeloyl-ACP methyl ester carboxylesterase